MTAPLFNGRDWLHGIDPSFHYTSLMLRRRRFIVRRIRSTREATRCSSHRSRPRSNRLQRVNDSLQSKSYRRTQLLPTNNPRCMHFNPRTSADQRRPGHGNVANDSRNRTGQQLSIVRDYSSLQKLITSQSTKHAAKQANRREAHPPIDRNPHHDFEALSTPNQTSHISETMSIRRQKAPRPPSDIREKDGFPDSDDQG